MIKQFILFDFDLAAVGHIFHGGDTGSKFIVAAQDGELSL
jgi:hypothetical protein